MTRHSKKLGKIRYEWSNGGSLTSSPHIVLTPPPKVSSSKASSSKKGRGSDVSASKQKVKPAKFQVHIQFGMQNIDWIPNLRLVPNRCNIKQPNLTTSDSDDGDEDIIDFKIQSQLYNHNLMYDSRHVYEDNELAWLRDAGGGAAVENHKKYSHPNIESTLVLIQVWALQRGLWRNHDGWSKENVALLLLYLLRTNRMNPRMTPIQLFTVVLQTWSTTNWLGDTTTSQNEKDYDAAGSSSRTIRAAQTFQQQQTGNSSKKRSRRTVLVLPSEGYNEGQTIERSQLGQLYRQQTKESPITDHDPTTLLDAYQLTNSYHLGPVFLDPTLSFNYLGHVSPNYMRLLQQHAQKSLTQHAVIQSKSSFGALFMKPLRFWNQFDFYVRIPVAERNSAATNKAKKSANKKQNKKQQQIISNDQQQEWELSTRRIVRILQRALGNRVHALRVLSTGNGDVGDGKDSDDDSNDTPDLFPNFVVTKNNVKSTNPRRE